MNGSAIERELSGFASRLFEHCGGLVEWEQSGNTGTAVIPRDVAELFHCEEAVSLSSRPESEGICISLASDFLENADLLLRSAVSRVGTFELPERYLKGGDLQRAVDRAFTWHNARVRVHQSAAERVEYQTWWFFASLKSEDVWESRLSVTINASSQVPVDLPDLLNLPDLNPSVQQDSAGPDTFDAAVSETRRRMLREAGAFIRRMESRLERDRKRLREYYGALKREVGHTKRRTVAPATPEDTAARKRIVDMELARKLGELAERYQMQAVLQPLLLVRVQVQVLGVQLSVQRKRAQRVHTVYWNPLNKQFEPLCCSQCGAGSYSFSFTNDDVDPVCSRCMSR